MIASIDPVLLPYHNLLSGRRGYQFGLPSAEGGTDILILFDNGDTERISNPILLPPNPAKGKPPQPPALWPLVKEPYTGVTKMHRVHAPKKGPGSSPITKKTVRPRYVYSPSKSLESGRPHFVNRPVICTPAGRDHFRECIDEHAPGEFLFDLCPADFPQDTPLPTSWAEHLLANGMYDEVLEIEVSLGVMPFAVAWVQDETLLAVQPERFALEHGLWTVHLVAGVLSQIANVGGASDTPLSFESVSRTTIEGLREEIARTIFDPDREFEVLGDGLVEHAAIEAAYEVVERHGFFVVEEVKRDDRAESVLLGRVVDMDGSLGVTMLELCTTPEGFRPFEDVRLLRLALANEGYLMAGNILLR
jgi:hypothetical protein